MARWSEGRGYTLILTHPRGPDRYVRVALVSKRTLFGLAYNIREARAEDAARSGREPAALGLGRMLSWRWLGEREAGELLAARLRTLETLGYAVLGDDAPTRGPWDWLRDLVARQLGRASEPDKRDNSNTTDKSDKSGTTDKAGAAASAETPDPAQALRESLERLGLEPHAVMEGLATILEIEEAKLREPSAEVLAAVEPELLAMLLPVWLGSESAQLREVGQRWLALPATLYELDVAVVERWLSDDGRMASELAPRLEREGLALLGPEALARLAHTASQARVSSVAKHWHARLQAPAR